MKQKISFLLIFWISVSTFAQYQRNLVIVSGNNEPVQVFINNERINNTGLNEIRITGLVDKYYNVRVVFLNQSHNSMTESLYVPPLSEIVYEVYPPERRQRRGEFLIANVYPVDDQLPYYQPQQIFSFGAQVISTQPANNGQVTQAGQINININNNSSAVNQGSNTAGDPIVYVPDYNGEIGCTPPITPDRYQSMLDAVEQQSFESTKLRVAKQIIKKNNCMTVNQLLGILRLFDFDNSKLTLAKFAYHYVYDIENYYKVNKVFDFDSNVKELDEYINSQE